MIHQVKFCTCIATLFQLDGYTIIGVRFCLGVCNEKIGIDWFFGKSGTALSCTNDVTFYIYIIDSTTVCRTISFDFCYGEGIFFCAVASISYCCHQNGKQRE